MGRPPRQSRFRFGYGCHRIMATAYSGTNNRDGPHSFTSCILGYREKRRIEKKYGSATIALEETRDLQAKGEKPKLLWANLLLTILVVIMLVWGVISAGLIFMIAVSIALIMNYRTADEQSNSIKDNAASALTMGTIILAAGSFLGILSGTG